MPLQARLVLLVLSLFTAGYMLVHAGLVEAVNGPPGGQSPSVDCLPGWGFGDKNHEHCGPPGRSTLPPPTN